MMVEVSERLKHREMAKHATTDTRKEVLRLRNERAKTRTRFCTCPACLEREYSNRDTADVCNQCLLNMWRAEDVSLAAMANTEENPKLVGARMTTTYHWLPHPSLGFGRDPVITGDMVFHRMENPFRNDPTVVKSPSSTLQRLYIEIMEGMAECYPVPPGVQTITFLKCVYDNDMEAMIPTKTLSALLDLWAMVEWMTKENYAQGFAAGSDLLNGMLLGQHTAEGFADTVARQTKAMQEQVHKAATGKLPAGY